MCIWYLLVLFVLIVPGCKNNYDEKTMSTEREQSSLCADIKSAIERDDDLNLPIANDISNYTYLHLAAIDGDIEAMHMLLEQKINVNVKDNIGFTPLHRAAQTGHTKAALLLLESKADVNALNKLKSSPLCFAIIAEHNSKELVELFLQHGADISIIDDFHGTVLHWAAYKGNKEALELLLNNGADVNAKNGRGFTPLHVAALYGYPEIAKILLKHGADPEAKSDSGTPIYVAKYESVPDHVSGSGKKKVAEIIQEYINNQSTK